MNEYEENLIKTLKNSGFGAEALAINRFHKKGWNNASPAIYLDEDAQISREIDALAFKRFPILSKDGKEQLGLISNTMVGEVKTSQEPWVTFCHRSTRAFYSSKETMTVKNSPFPDERLFAMVRTRFETITDGWNNSNLCEPVLGKKAEEKNRFFSACCSLTKAIHFLKQSTKKKKGLQLIPRVVKEPHIFEYIQPLVILSGRLYRAVISEEDSFEVTEIPQTSVRFTYKSPTYDLVSYHIDICTLDHLSAYLDNYNKLHESIVTEFRSAMPNADFDRFDSWW